MSNSTPLVSKDTRTDLVSEDVPEKTSSNVAAQNVDNSKNALNRQLPTAQLERYVNLAYLQIAQTFRTEKGGSITPDFTRSIDSEECESECGDDPNFTWIDVESEADSESSFEENTSSIGNKVDSDKSPGCRNSKI